MITFLAIAAAAVFLLWPSPKKAPQPIAPPELAPPVVVPRSPSYQAAMSCLADVRARLSHTEKLGEKETAAIDTITLALVAGSDDK